jgi:hypothetical protein
VAAAALIIAPLGVRQEFRRDAKMLGLQITFVRRTEEVTGDGLFITNYESVRDGRLDPHIFDAVSLDEASCLRGFGGTKTFREFMALFAGDRKTLNARTRSKGIKFRFVATATPSPNEYVELLAYAAFLDIMDVSAAKTRFFKRDSTKADNLTIHPHKERSSGCGSRLGDVPPAAVRPRIFRRRVLAAGDARRLSRGRGRPLDGHARQGRPGADVPRGDERRLSEAAREKRDTLEDRIAAMRRVLDENPDDSFLIWHDLEASATR